MRLAIIPARGGSKRIPRKNILPFRGKPMIAWSIEAALESGCFDAVIVSTDDPEISAIAQAHGATAPFMRPAELADDFTPTIPVLRHAVAAFEKATSQKVELACCIYATAPFLRPSDLQKGETLLKEDPELDFAFSVTSFPFPIQRALQINESDRISMLHPEHELSRSQDLPERFHDAGQFYWFRPAPLATHDGFFSANAAPIHLPRERVQDIDTPEDWQCAELAHELLEKGGRL
ncbi:pseudaminic acid cytidylyltransferase [bacterium]|nr:pseudaminic acid cytidylyltransferase [Akkermansiaceae bacterium]MDB4311594.1 pseudaminic acid cytidylyltransferase [bacterium]MDB4276258.1 pseudaminic acid cytidylyltransferase [Akkermansiaceae bacterium]MDB4304768.1 pseudaminic acid cytidylyltransferase [Akkermansiaceae bacterium]MDB4320690.1 pseudaminic acid cytidylyltransferase [Akkermansiaceae bacterium]